MQIHIENWGEEKDKKIKTVPNLANNVLVYLFSYILCMCEKLHMLWTWTHMYVFIMRDLKVILAYISWGLE